MTNEPQSGRSETSKPVSVAARLPHTLSESPRQPSSSLVESTRPLSNAPEISRQHSEQMRLTMESPHQKLQSPRYILENNGRGDAANETALDLRNAPRSSPVPKPTLPSQSQRKLLHNSFCLFSKNKHLQLSKKCH